MEESEYPSDSARKQPGRGSTILVLGILSLVICALLGPFAWVMGKGDLEKMDRGIMDETDRGTTKAGVICGIIGTILMILGIIWAIFIFLAGSSVALSAS